MENSMKPGKKTGNDELNRIRALFESAGFNVNIGG